MRLLSIIVVYFCLLGPVFALTEDNPLPSVTDETRAQALFHDIRCVVCQSESIADSPADIARDMRNVIRAHVARGDSDRDIKDYLSSHYGDYVLMKPPLKPATAMLWFGPLLIVLTAGLVTLDYFQEAQAVMLYGIFFLILVVALGMVLGPVYQGSDAQKKFCACVAIVFFMAAFGIYAVVGSPEILPMLAARESKLAELKDTILKDSAAVKANPKDLKAWVELGASFAETSQFDAAANAFKQAVLISGGNPTLITAYAKALIERDDGKVSDNAKKSLEMALLLQPDNAEARYYLIVRKLQDGNTKDAMKEMKALYGSLPEGSPLKEMINRQIGK